MRMDKIGPYEILETLHRGPQPLYRVKAPDGRILALKAAPVANATPESRERFSREAETCRTLDHPHLVRVVEGGEADGMLYQVMELLEGADLGKVLGEGRQFSWDEKLSIMEQVSEGLQYAHERHLVHRDIKPANLFLENTGRTVVLDFGMVQVAESQLTKIGSALGTVNYMAPEQIRGERCTAASDVFSAGIVFFQLASGRHPFSTKDRSLAQIVSAIVFEPPPKLSEICPDAPEGLEFVLNRALEKEPSKRLQNAGELRQSIAVCRLAMSPIFAAAPAQAGTTDAAKNAEGEKTKVFSSAKPAAPDLEKTQVFRRPAPSPMAVPPKPAAPAAPAPTAVAPAAPKHTPGLRFRYCPSCTSANPPDAEVCSRCGQPLTSAAAATKATNWGMYIAVAVAVLLAMALVVVLVVRR
jgi:serine/threonine protein kinase/predicted nucleic acid-binding Zn ribbon protein